MVWHTVSPTSYNSPPPTLEFGDNRLCWVLLLVYHMLELYACALALKWAFISSHPVPQYTPSLQFPRLYQHLVLCSCSNVTTYPRSGSQIRVWTRHPHLPHPYHPHRPHSTPPCVCPARSEGHMGPTTRGIQPFHHISQSWVNCPLSLAMSLSLSTLLSLPPSLSPRDLVPAAPPTHTVKQMLI